jgi:secreted trypsin-like serine protease
VKPLPIGSAQRRDRPAECGTVSRWCVPTGGGAQAVLGVLAALLASLGAPSEARALVGGELAKGGQWPTAVFLEAVGCSGAVVAPRLVLTAAHCLMGRTGHHDRVVVGDDLRAPRRIVRVEACYVHPGFQFTSSDDDIAACTLAESLPSEDIASPLSPDEERRLATPQSFVLVGFGTTEPLGSRDGHKRWLQTGVFHGEGGKVDQIGDARHTTCAGDSGGPALVQLQDGTWRTAALASAATRGACTGASNYVRLAAHRHWLARVAGTAEITPSGSEAPSAKLGLSFVVLAGLVAITRRRTSARIIRE